MGIYEKIKKYFWYYLFGCVVLIYFYGIVINAFRNATENFYSGAESDVFSLNPFVCIKAVFTPQGLGVFVFIAIMYIIITGKWN